MGISNETGLVDVHNLGQIEDAECLLAAYIQNRTSILLLVSIKHVVTRHFN